MLRARDGAVRHCKLAIGVSRRQGELEEARMASSELACAKLTPTCQTTVWGPAGREWKASEKRDADPPPPPAACLVKKVTCREKGGRPEPRN